MLGLRPLAGLRRLAVAPRSSRASSVLQDGSTSQPLFSRADRESELSAGHEASRVAPGSWEASFTVESGARFEPAQALDVVTETLRGHGVAVHAAAGRQLSGVLASATSAKEELSGLLTSVATVNAAKLATSLDWLEIRTGISVNFRPVGEKATFEVVEPPEAPTPPDELR